VTLREGAPAHIRSLNLVGLELLTPDQRQSATDVLPLAVGEIFLEEKWTAAKALLAAALREFGYATAVVTGEAVVDADAAQVDLTVIAAPGTRFRLGKVFVANDSGAKVRARLIADVANVPVGDWFSESALQQAQGRVSQMGVFSGVKVNRGAPDPGTATVPVVVDVREAPFSNARVGFGLGGDLIRQEVRVVGEYTNRNLGLTRIFLKDAQLDRLTLKAKLGWAFLPTLWDVAANNPNSQNGPTARLLAEYEVPRVLGVRTLAFQSSLELQRMIDAAYSYLGGEVKVGLIWRPRTDLSIFPSLNFDLYRLTEPVSIRDNVPAATLGCPALTACLISYLEVNAQFDRRDSRLEPKDGFMVELSVQGGLAQTTLIKPYLRIVPAVSGDVSFGKDKRVTLAGRLRLGTLISTDEKTPIVARFFSGGSNMRGFNSRRLSTQRPVPRFVDPDDPRCPAGTDVTAAGCPLYADSETLAVGGNGLIEASLELRWNVWGDLVLALFTDWGLVTTAPLGPKTNLGQKLYASVGLGVRYRTPLGPIRLDLGVRLPFIGGPLDIDMEEVDPRTKFRSNPGCFFGTFAPPPTAQDTPMNYGGSPDGLCNVHLSIGEAF
jgi:translocation and assembly module TamA